MASKKIDWREIPKFDSADYIQDAKDAHHYLVAALEDSDLAHLLRALNTVCRALGVAKIAKSAGLTRDGLYKLLAGSHPSFEALHSVLKAFDIDLLSAAGRHYARARRAA